jgi:hypothetical protein
VTHASADVRLEAYVALGRIGDVGAVPLLLERVNLESGYPRAAINETLGLLGDENATAHLLKDCHFPDTRSKGLIPGNFGPMGGPPPYPAHETAVATAAVRALGRLGAPSNAKSIAELADDVLRNESFWSAVAWSLGEVGNAEVGDALVRLGIEGAIKQGFLEVPIPVQSRCQAVQSMAKLKMDGLVSQLLAMRDNSTPLELRRVGAAVLTDLTGRPHSFRVPLRTPRFFLRASDSPNDLTPFNEPIFREVREQN